MLTLIATGLIACVIPVLVLSTMLARHQASWRPHYQREEQVFAAGDGAFRSTELKGSRWKIVGDGLPLSVAIASFTCVFVGQMVIPTAPLALLGLLIGLEGTAGQHGFNLWLVLYALSFIPGAVCAIQTFRCGTALLRGIRSSAAKTIRLNTIFNLTHNALLLAGILVARLQHERDFEFAYVALGYGAVVVLHTLVVQAVFTANQEKFVAQA
jgi:heme exporter protein D